MKWFLFNLLLYTRTANYFNSWTPAPRALLPIPSERSAINGNFNPNFSILKSQQSAFDYPASIPLANQYVFGRNANQLGSSYNAWGGHVEQNAIGGAELNAIEDADECAITITDGEQGNSNTATIASSENNSISMGPSGIGKPISAKPVCRRGRPPTASIPGLGNTRIANQPSTTVSTSTSAAKKRKGPIKKKQGSKTRRAARAKQAKINSAGEFAIAPEGIDAETRRVTYSRNAGSVTSDEQHDGGLRDNFGDIETLD